VPLSVSILVQSEGKSFCMNTSGNLDRHFIVYKPDGTSDRPLPVVFMFHGASGSGERVYNISGGKEKAEREGVIAVFLTTKRYCLRGEERNRYIIRWNAGALQKEVCESETLADDVQFLRDMAGYLKESCPGDNKRIYASGFSDNYVSRLTVEASDILAATAVVAGMLQDTTWHTRALIPSFLAVGQNEKLLSRADGSPLPITPNTLEEHEFLRNVLFRMVDKLGLERKYTCQEEKYYTLYPEQIGGRQPVQAGTGQGRGTQLSERQQLSVGGRGCFLEIFTGSMKQTKGS